MTIRLLPLLVAVHWFLLDTGFADSAKPVAVVGASYGQSEIQSIIRNVLTVSDERQCRYEKLGTAVPTDNLGRYSLVIIAHSLEKPLTPEENRAFSAYVHDGGHVLLISQAHNDIVKDLPPEEAAWTGIQRVAWQREGTPCTVLQADCDWLTGVLDERPEPDWLKARFLAIPLPGGMRAVIGTDTGASLVGIHPFGAGWVAFLGHELFRMRPPQDTNPENRSAWIRLIANLVDAANPLRESAYRTALYKAEPSDDAVLLWTREWQQGETYGPRFDPPLPTPEERVTSLSADLAIDEYELLQLNLTPLKTLGSARLSFSSATFPTEHVNLFVQDRPDPIPWPKNPAIAQEAPYWLMPPTAVEPRGSSAFAVSPHETRVLWIKLDSFGVAPGSYTAALHLDFDDSPRVTLPLSIRVYPVRLPAQRLIKLMPSGTVYGDVRNAAPAVPFMLNLKSHGFEWSIFNVVRPADAHIRGETTPLNVAALRRCADWLAEGKEPVIDFSVYDDWIESSIEHRQTRVRTADLTYYLRGLIHQAGITEAKQVVLLENWFCGEFARYLREKGVRIMVSSLGDELSRKELLERYIPWAQRMGETGWGCSSSFTGIQHADPELNRLLYPYVTLWTLNRGLALPFTEGVRKGTLTVRPDAIIGTYGGGEGRGTEIRKIPSQSRFLGWESWKLGIQNCAPNPYFKGWLYYVDYGDRGIAGERFVSYLDQNDPQAPLLNSPFLEGIREGLEDGNLCAILSWYLNHLPASPLTASVRARFDRVMSQNPDALLPYQIREGSNKLRVLTIQADSAAYRAAKREVLDCLNALQTEALATIRPTLYWNDVPLMTNGMPLAAIYTDATSTEGLMAEIQTLCGLGLPVLHRANRLDPRYPVAIVLDNGTQNPLAAALLTEAQETDATAVYPGSGRYFIKQLPNPDAANGTVLIVAGPDAEGTAKGIRLFSRFLHSEGAWIQTPTEQKRNIAK